MGNTIKIRAIKLRRNGWSYGEIKKQIKVSKSTLSLWLKSIPLSPQHKNRLYTKQIEILSRGSQSQKERRKREIEEIINLAEKEISTPIGSEAFRFLGAALYWAEGSKYNMFQITNSDPSLILFMVRWVERIFQIHPSKLRARLNIYPQQNEKSIKDFWSELTGIPSNNFGKSYVKPAGKNYKKNNLYYGTVRVEVPKSVDLRLRTYGWLKAVLKTVGTDVQRAESRWHRLKKTGRPVNLKLR